MPVYMAVYMGHAGAIEALGRLGADVNRARLDGWTPLGIARRKGHSAAAAALERQGRASWTWLRRWAGSA
jgi:ankyrin repeat protein